MRLETELQHRPKDHLGNKCRHRPRGRHIYSIAHTKTEGSDPSLNGAPGSHKEAAESKVQVSLVGATQSYITALSALTSGAESFKMTLQRDLNPLMQSQKGSYLKF